MIDGIIIIICWLTTWGVAAVIEKPFLTSERIYVDQWSYVTLSTPWLRKNKIIMGLIFGLIGGFAAWFCTINFKIPCNRAIAWGIGSACCYLFHGIFWLTLSRRGFFSDFDALWTEIISGIIGGSIAWVFFKYAVKSSESIISWIIVGPLALNIYRYRKYLPTGPFINLFFPDGSEFLYWIICAVISGVIWAFAIPLSLWVNYYISFYLINT